MPPKTKGKGVGKSSLRSASRAATTRRDVSDAESESVLGVLDMPTEDDGTEAEAEENRDNRTRGRLRTRASIDQEAEMKRHYERQLADLEKVKAALEEREKKILERNEESLKIRRAALDSYEAREQSQDKEPQPGPSGISSEELRLALSLIHI